MKLPYVADWSKDPHTMNAEQLRGALEDLRADLGIIRAEIKKKEKIIARSDRMEVTKRQTARSRILQLNKGARIRLQRIGICANLLGWIEDAEGGGDES